MEYANAIQPIRALNQTQNNMSGADCQYCANYRNRGGRGCGRTICAFQDLKDEAIRNARTKRDKRERGSVK